MTKNKTIGTDSEKKNWRNKKKKKNNNNNPNSIITKTKIATTSPSSRYQSYLE